MAVAGTEPDLSGALAAAVAELEAAGRFGVRPGLSRTRWLLDQFDRPDEGLTGVLVAGTNGKGSVSALVEAMSRSAGRRTALLAKPHLVRWGERIALDGVPIADAAFARLAEEVLATAAGAPDDERPTQFEMLTAMGVLAARRHGAQILVCEVGMGGRQDSTNVLDLGGCLITNVDLDHREWLGDTVTAIAAEKAGIIKAGNWAVTAATEPARSVIRRRAAEVTADLEALERDRDWQGVSLDRQGIRAHVRLDQERWLACECPLAGRYQLENLAVAVRAAHRLGLPQGAIRDGASRVRWPGRLQWIEGAPALLLDGAHNPAAMAELAAAVPGMCAGRRTVILFGVMADKQIEQMLDELRALPGEVVLTSVAGGRAAPASRLADRFEGGTVVEPAAAGLAEARRRAGPGGVVVVCGSLALVGAVLGMVGAG